MTQFPPPPSEGPPPEGPPPGDPGGATPGVPPDGTQGSPPVPAPAPGMPAAPPPPAPIAYAAPAAPAADRVRMAWQRRNETDYIFDFWTALGWTILTCGIYGFYVLYQLVRRSRDHNVRRIELLDAATTFAWERAEAQGKGEQLRPNFERIGASMATLRNQTTQFRDPVIWTVLSIIASGIVHYIVYILLDGDRVTHDHAEGAIEAELSDIYGQLGTSVPAPNPGRLQGKHNYVGRVIATLATCGIYALWWQYNIMVELNHHFEENWKWEDGLASSVQQLIA